MSELTGICADRVGKAWAQTSFNETRSSCLSAMCNMASGAAAKKLASMQQDAFRPANTSSLRTGGHVAACAIRSTRKRRPGRGINTGRQCMHGMWLRMSADFIVVVWSTVVGSCGFTHAAMVCPGLSAAQKEPMCLLNKQNFSAELLRAEKSWEERR